MTVVLVLLGALGVFGSGVVGGWLGCHRRHRARTADAELKAGMWEDTTLTPEDIANVQKAMAAADRIIPVKLPTADTTTSHTRTSTPHGPDFCAECSAALSEWVPWPCPGLSIAIEADDG